MHNRAWRTRHYLTFKAEPKLDPRCWKLISAVARHYQGMLSLKHSIETHDRRLLLSAQSLRERGLSLKPRDSAVARRNRTLQRLQKLGVTLPEGLDLVDADEEVFLRTPKLVAVRVAALFQCAMRAFALSEGEPDPGCILGEGFLELLSPGEQQFLANPRPDQQQLANMSWRTECAWVLMWALGVIPQLGSLAQQADAQQQIKLTEGILTDFEGFVEQSSLRPASDILDALDLLFCCYVAGETAHRLGQKIALNREVVHERHYALRWLTHHRFQEWDDLEVPVTVDVHLTGPDIPLADLESGNGRCTICGGEFIWPLDRTRQPRQDFSVTCRRCDVEMCPKCGFETGQATGTDQLLCPTCGGPLIPTYALG